MCGERSGKDLNFAFRVCLGLESRYCDVEGLVLVTFVVAAVSMDLNCFQVCFDFQVLIYGPTVHCNSFPKKKFFI